MTFDYDLMGVYDGVLAMDTNPACSCGCNYEPYTFRKSVEGFTIYPAMGVISKQEAIEKIEEFKKEMSRQIALADECIKGLKE